MRVVIVILFIISLPQLLLMAVIALLATPFALLELIALGVVGSAMGILRLVGRRPYRVEVIGHTEKKVHSLTTLLVRGDRAAADGVVAEISTSLVDGPRKYTPANLPANVSVRSHRTA